MAYPKRIFPTVGTITTTCAPINAEVLAEAKAVEQHPKLRSVDFLRYTDATKTTIDVSTTTTLLTIELERRGQLERWGRPVDAFKRYTPRKDSQILTVIIVFERPDGTRLEKHISQVWMDVNKTCSKSLAVVYFNIMNRRYDRFDHRVMHSPQNVLLALNLMFPAEFDEIRYTGRICAAKGVKYDLYSVRRRSDGKWSTADQAASYRLGKRPRFKHESALHLLALKAIESHPDRKFMRWCDDYKDPKVVTRCTKHNIENESFIETGALSNLGCRECLIEQQSRQFDWTIALERMCRLYAVTGVDTSDKSGVYVLKNDHTYKVGITKDFKARGYSEHFVASRRKSCSQMVALLIEQILLKEFDIKNAEKLPYDEYHALLPDLNGRSESFTSESVFLRVCSRFDQLKTLDLDTLINIYNNLTN